MQPRLAALALLALLAAGCSSPPQAQPTLAPPEPAAEAPAGPAFELLGCEGRSQFFVLDDRAVSAEMHSRRPYTVQGVAGALVDLETFRCDAVVGGVAEPDVPMARVTVAIGAGTSYLFEWVLPVAKAPLLSAWLGGHGWPVVDGDVQTLPGVVTVRGPAVDYAVLDVGEPAGGAVPATVEGGIWQLVHDAEAGTVRLAENRTVEGNGHGSSPQLVATRGVLSRFAPGGAGSASAGLAFLDVRFHSGFAEAEEQEQPVRN